MKSKSLKNPGFTLVRMGLFAATLAGMIYSVAAQANCNGWHARWCGERYMFEVNNIKSNIIPHLNARAAILPVQIADKTHERDLVGQMIEAADRETALHTAIMTKDQSMISLLEDELLPAACEAEANITALSSKIVPRIPAIISYLREFLVTKKQSIDARIQVLDDEIKNLSDLSKIEALLYEKAHLENLKIFSQSFSDQESFTQALIDITQGRFDAKAANLSMETVALLQEAAALRDLNISASQLFSSIRKGVQKLVDQLNSQLIRIENEMDSRHTELDQSILRKQKVQAQYEEVSRTINALQSEMNAIPGQIAHWNSRHDFAHTLWHCCDNEPFCQYLPGADQNADAYVRFEASISPPHHAKGCREGGDL